MATKSRLSSCLPRSTARRTDPGRSVVQPRSSSCPSCFGRASARCAGSPGGRRAGRGGGRTLRRGCGRARSGRASDAACGRPGRRPSGPQFSGRRACERSGTSDVCMSLATMSTESPLTMVASGQPRVPCNVEDHVAGNVEDHVAGIRIVLTFHSSSVGSEPAAMTRRSPGRCWHRRTSAAGVAKSATRCSSSSGPCLSPSGPAAPSVASTLRNQIVRTTAAGRSVDRPDRARRAPLHPAHQHDAGDLAAFLVDVLDRDLLPEGGADRGARVHPAPAPLQAIRRQDACWWFGCARDGYCAIDLVAVAPHPSACPRVAA
jgi:hypothetical protein